MKKKKPGDYESPGFQVLSLSRCGSNYKTEGQSMATTEAPSVEEQYVSANNSSNLRVEADRRSDADILIAAGMSQSRLGMALMRLHTEYDRTALPFGKVAETDYRLLLGRLKSLPDVREQVAFQASKWHFEKPGTVAITVIAWWLHKICRACHGRKFQTVPGSPALSSKHCKSCNGAGETPLPYGSDGKRLERFMDECVERAAASIKKRLRPTN